MSNEYNYIAMNRFSNGANEQAVLALANANTKADAQNWLLAQLKTYELPESSWSSQKAITAYYYFRQQEEMAKQAGDNSSNNTGNDTGDNTSKNPGNDTGDNADSTTDSKTPTNAIPSKQTMGANVTRRNLIEATRTHAQQTALANISAAQGLQAKLLDFFSNHLSITRANLPLTLLAPTLETEAIAPNLNGQFADMLLAAIRHPAMLLYLNNERSIGPNSRIGTNRQAKNRRAGLNENLAREIMELHTLGVGSGYTQQDVTELANALTGWSIGSVRRNEKPEFIFRHNAHEPGSRAVLGKRYAESAQSLGDKHLGDKQAADILQDLALHPATAAHISYKLAKHFIADTPDSSLVASMTQTWIATSGNIKAVVSAMIKHPASWQIPMQKFKTPREFVFSACRACGVDKPSPNLYQTLEILGHGFFNSGSPAGYADGQDTWLGVSALNARIEWASHFVKVVLKRKLTEPVDIANKALGPLLSDATLQAIKQAESKQQALALFLMSPEFQRR